MIYNIIKQPKIREEMKTKNNVISGLWKGQNHMLEIVYIQATHQAAGLGEVWRKAWRGWWGSWGCWDCGSCVWSVWWNPSGSLCPVPRAPPRSPGSCRRWGSAAGSCLNLRGRWVGEKKEGGFRGWTGSAERMTVRGKKSQRGKDNVVDPQPWTHRLICLQSLCWFGGHHC